MSKRQSTMDHGKSQVSDGILGSPYNTSKHIAIDVRYTINPKTVIILLPSHNIRTLYTRLVITSI